MIRARTRMCGSRIVVLMTGPTHTALESIATGRARAADSFADRDCLVDALIELARCRVARLLGLPEPFRSLLN
jgi:hypothetical protein